jgi:poly-gamma-glutamate synthesis protein (capsule biosynthesis protein)
MSKIHLLVLLFPAFILSSPHYEVIENFDDGTVELLSYPGQDIHPNRWTLDSINTYNNSAYSLKIYGNTWKMESVNFIALDSNDVWQVSAYVDKLGEIQGFGLKDSAHTLFYAFAGTEQLNIQDWVTVYQGAFPQDTWNTYALPVAEDWLNWFGYLPTITNIVFINDRDADTSAIIYFDEIINITDNLPIAPQVTIWDSIGEIFIDRQGRRNVNVQFYSRVIDPDSKSHEYFWSFSDDSTSNDSNPVHTYLVEDDHEYTVLLQVRDSTNLWGRATCQVLVDSGQTSFPITMNFVGDIMLARRYELPGGVIDTLGVEGIFDPTFPYLGNAADITVANLECPLTTHGTPHPTKPIVFRGRPENVAGLVHAGIDIVSLANNHIIDYGLDGLQETQSVLDSNHILYSGAGANSYEAYLPIFRLKNGVNIAFLASSDRTGQYDNYQPYLNAGYNKPGFANLDTFYLSQQISEVDTIADLKVVEMHSGSEYGLSPRLDGLSQKTEYNGDEFFSPQVLLPCTSDIAVRHYAIDQGADLVICHHPHIIQGFEIYNGKLIAHSLGNFAFDLDYPETYPSVILNTKINQNGFYDYSVTPIYIDDYIPRRAKGELGIHILGYLAQRSKELGAYLIVNRDSVTGKIVLDTQNLTPTTTSYNNPFQLAHEGSYWTSQPVKLPQDGNISSITNITPQRSWQARLGRDMTWLWFGNFEDEGSTMWLLNNVNEFYDTVAYQGTRSLSQIRPAASLPLITNLENRIICYSDSSRYTLYGYLKTENTSNSSIFVKCYSTRTGSSPFGTASLDTVTGTSDWRFHYKEFTPAEGTGYFDIWLRSDASQTTQCRTWYDNVGIVEWGDWQSIDSLGDIPTPNDYYWIQIRTNQQTSNATLYYEETDYNPHSAISDNTIETLRFKSFQIYPNPTKSFPLIRYNLLKSTKVVLKIYNILGQEVKTLVNGIQTQGLKNISWDGRDNQRRALPSGVYFCRLQVADSNQSQKIILLSR